VRGEPGSETVRAAMGASVLSAVNLTETMAKLIHAGGEPRLVERYLRGLQLESFHGTKSLRGKAATFARWHGPMASPSRTGPAWPSRGIYGWRPSPAMRRGRIWKLVFAWSFSGKARGGESGALHALSHLHRRRTWKECFCVVPQRSRSARFPSSPLSWRHDSRHVYTPPRGVLALQKYGGMAGPNACGRTQPPGHLPSH
jgi:hypothetical protein